MRNWLLFATIFTASFVAVAFVPLISVRKGADFVLGRWTLATAYSDPIQLWLFVLLHMLLSAFVFPSAYRFSRPPQRLA